MCLVKLARGSDHKIRSIFLFHFKVSKSEQHRVRRHFFLLCFRRSLLASLISTLYHGTSGCDLMVLVTTGACRSRVFGNVCCINRPPQADYRDSVGTELTFACH